MKLLTKISIYYLFISIVLFGAVGIFYYSQLKDIVNEDDTENLYREKELIVKFVNDSAKIPYQSIYFGDVVTFSRETVIVSERLKDTMMYNPLEEEIQPYRQLVIPLSVKGQNYSATISKPMFESEDLIENIGLPLAGTAFATMILLMLFTWLLQRQTWKPFYSILNRLKDFDLNKNKPVSFPETKTAEFVLLQREISRMTEKIRQDYQSLKEFTEDASHELQTPLAVISSKIEIMIQSEELSREQMKLLQDMFESISKLSKLNQSLLLLAKIENSQFSECEPVAIQELIENKLNMFEEMFSFRNIIIEKNFTSSPVINMNPLLADILFTNLINNSIKHNFSGGKIRLKLNKDSFEISNTGKPPGGDPVKMFQRFQKAGSSADSVGLGLAIVKKICDTYGYIAEYIYSEGLHIITIRF